MNFYNPYYMPYTYTSRGLLGGLFRGINFTSILNGAQRTLNVVNQAIPVFKEISPIIKNAKTMFRVVNEFNKSDKSNSNIKEINSNYSDGPTFFN